MCNGDAGVLTREFEGRWASTKAFCGGAGAKFVLFALDILGAEVVETIFFCVPGDVLPNPAKLFIVSTAAIGTPFLVTNGAILNGTSVEVLSLFWDRRESLRVRSLAVADC